MLYKLETIIKSAQDGSIYRTIIGVLLDYKVGTTFYMEISPAGKVERERFEVADVEEDFIYLNRVVIERTITVNQIS